MYGFGKSLFRTVTAIALAVPSVLSAEGGYPDRNSGLPNRPNTYYGDLISAQRQANPQGSGESDAAYQIRINKLAADAALTAPDDTAGTNGGGVDRSEKLADAAVLAGEGEKAATTQAANLQIWAITQGINGSIVAAGTGGTSSSDAAAAAADLALASDAAAKYAAIQKDMGLAAYHNGTGKARLRYDPEDGDPEAGTPTAANPNVVAATVAGLSPDTVAALKDKGLDPEKVVERLLSGEVDTKDPAAVLKELGDTRELSVNDLAEARRLTEAKLNDPDYNPLSLLGDPNAAGDKGGEKAAGPDKDKAEKQEKAEKESNQTNPGLAGIAIRLINRDVMGFKLGKFLGFKDTAPLTASPKGRAPLGNGARGLTKGSGKKSLTAVDFYRLKDHGVTAPRHGSNIFTIAHRQYRDFTKWRTVKKGRVAVYP